MINFAISIPEYHTIVAWDVALGRCTEILPGPFIGRLQVPPDFFLLDDQHSRPAKVYETEVNVQFRDMHLVTRDNSALHCERVEDGTVGALRFASLIG